MNPVLGCLRDKYDGNDILMRSFLQPFPLPDHIDYTDQMTPVRNQGNEGTCVAFASAVGMKEYQDSKENKEVIELSPRWVYAECKKIDGYPGEEGTSLTAAMKVLKKLGTCYEQDWPYQPHQTDMPNDNAWPDAYHFRIASYARIIGLNDLKKTLAQFGPPVFAIDVYNSFYDAKDGVVPMPPPGDTFLGGHALCAVGYDEKTKLIKFKNSWGDWGDNGYGYLPYEYIGSYMSDAWSSVDMIDDHAMHLSDIFHFVKGFFR